MKRRFPEMGMGKDPKRGRGPALPLAALKPGHILVSPPLACFVSTEGLGVTHRGYRMEVSLQPDPADGKALITIHVTSPVLIPKSQERWLC